MKSRRERFGEQMLRPVGIEFKISSAFGVIDKGLRNDKPHTGVDFACPVKTPARAPFDGTVVMIRRRDEGREHDRRAGNRLGVLSLDGKTYALFFHLHDFCVPLWTRVERGQLVALTGSTGYVTGPHLHFETRDRDGLAFNPEPFDEK